VLADAEGMRDLYAEVFDPSPEAQRRLAERQLQAKVDRAAERATAGVVSLDLVGLLDRLGWSVAYGRHLVQPYCTCGPGSDGGWDVFRHAEDLGVRDA